MCAKIILLVPPPSQLLITEISVNISNSVPPPHSPRPPCLSDWTRIYQSAGRHQEPDQNLPTHSSISISLRITAPYPSPSGLIFSWINMKWEARRGRSAIYTSALPVSALQLSLNSVCAVCSVYVHMVCVSKFLLSERELWWVLPPPPPSWFKACY